MTAKEHARFQVSFIRHHYFTTVQCPDAGSYEWSRGERLLRWFGKLGGFYSTKAVGDIRLGLYCGLNNFSLQVLSRSAKELYNSCVDSVDYAAIVRGTFCC